MKGINMWYLIEEWDGTQFVVAIKHDGDSVLVQYLDGVCHRVSKDYFFNTVVRPLDGPISN